METVVWFLWTLCWPPITYYTLRMDSMFWTKAALDPSHGDDGDAELQSPGSLHRAEQIEKRKKYVACVT